MKPFDCDGVFRQEAASSELRYLAVRGAVATISISGVLLGTQVIGTIVLARLLTPSDFGVVAMVTTFSLLVGNFGLNGFTEAIIQFHEIDHYTVSNLFWLNTGAGVVLAIALSSAGSLLARFYGNPLVAKIAIGVSVGNAIMALSVIPLALLQRAMHFAITSANDAIGRAAYVLVAIVLAVKGWGFWALVIGSIAQWLSVTVGAFVLCPWVPSLPRRTGRTGSMVRFAMSVYGRYILRYFTQNVDYLLVGWRFNADALAFYKKAYDLFALSAMQITLPLNRVALASLSRVNQDRDRMIRYFSNLLGIIALVGMAVGANLTLVGSDVVQLVLGPQWTESGRIFELFGPGIGVMLISSTVGWLHLSIGNPGRWFRWTLVELIVTTSLFVIALPWGPAGIALAWSVAYGILLIPSFWYAGRPIEFGISTLISTIWRYIVAALLAALSTRAMLQRTQFWTIHPGPVAALEAIVIISLLFVMLYAAAVILLHGGLTPFRRLIGLLQELTRSRRGSGELAELMGELQ